MTSIKRADTASVENYSMFGNSLHDGKAIFVRTARIARLAVVTIARLNKFPRNQGRVRARFSLVIGLGWVELWGREYQQC